MALHSKKWGKDSENENLRPQAQNNLTCILPCLCWCLILIQKSGRLFQKLKLNRMKGLLPNFIGKWRCFHPFQVHAEQGHKSQGPPLSMGTQAQGSPFPAPGLPCLLTPLRAQTCHWPGASPPHLPYTQHTQTSPLNFTSNAQENFSAQRLCQSPCYCFVSCGPVP